MYTFIHTTLWIGRFQNPKSRSFAPNPFTHNGGEPRSPHQAEIRQPEADPIKRPT